MTPFYDPMIAKLIAHGPTRDAAIDRISNALDRTLIAGVRSNVAFLGALCRAKSFREGKVDTGFIDRNLAALGAVPRSPDRAAAAAGVARLLAGEEPSLPPKEANSPWAARDGFQLGGQRSVTVPVVIDGDSANATVTYGKDGMKVASTELHQPRREDFRCRR